MRTVGQLAAAALGVLLQIRKKDSESEGIFLMYGGGAPNVSERFPWENTDFLKLHSSSHPKDQGVRFGSFQRMGHAFNNNAVKRRIFFPL